MAKVQTSVLNEWRNQEILETSNVEEFANPRISS